MKTISNTELEEKIMNHDCSLSQEDGCECSKWIGELAELKVESERDYYDMLEADASDDDF